MSLHERLGAGRLIYLPEVAHEHMSRIGSHEVLYECGRLIGLQDCISTNPSQRLEPPSRSMVAKAVQALVGAIWLDSQESMQDVRRVLQALGLLNVPNGNGM